MSTVGSATALLSTLYDNVGNNALISVETSDFAVSFQVAQKFTDGLDGLFGPSASGLLLNFALGVS